MAPKRANTKKMATKVSASSADAEVFNNGLNEVADESTGVAKILANGTSSEEGEDIKEATKLKVVKRSSGRSKNVAPEVGTEVAPSKKASARGRGKNTSNENEVIKNESDSIQQPENQEFAETKENKEVKTKPKGRGGGKKAESKTKKIATVKESKKEAISSENTQKDDSNNGEETNLPEKKPRAMNGRKKKQEVLEKTEEQIEVKQDIKENIDEVKISKKSSRSGKNPEGIPAENGPEFDTEIEPQKKKGKNAKKEKIVKDESELVTNAELFNEVKPDVTEKKTSKRSRAAAKAVPAIEEIPINGDNEEVLPKKRSRKAAPVIKKETVKDKPKKGRGQKADKVAEEILENEVELKEKEDENATIGQAKEEKTEIREEPQSSSLEAEKQIDTVAPAPTVAATKNKGGRKRAAPSTNNKKSSTKKSVEDVEILDDGVDNTEVEDEADGSKTSKTKKSKTNSAPLLNSIVSNYNKADFDLPPVSDGQTAEEPRFNFKISSWNVAGLRSWLKKEGLKFLDYEQPDIFCMQETKCTNELLPEEVVPIPGYHPYWLCMTGGYAGVAIYSKIMPINVEYGIGNKEFDENGRIITAEYEKFFLINVYVPNSGRKLVNLEARMNWEKLFQQFIQNLDARKPVVICGDMNVSHQEIDLANPKSNTRNAGFTKEEREKMTELLALGYIDTFRHLYPERKGAYTFWSYMGSARSRNVGWRLDYFIVSERFIKRVVDNCIRIQCMGSDHCPITLFLKL